VIVIKYAKVGEWQIRWIKELVNGFGGQVLVFAAFI
jgi:hypothetical protein